VRHYRLERISDLLQDVANQYSVEYVDILPFLQKEESAALWVTPADPHPNAHANDLIAQGLYRALRPIAANVRQAGWPRVVSVTWPNTLPVAERR
jgi:hypothetical protein